MNKSFNPKYDDNKKDGVIYIDRVIKNSPSSNEYRAIYTLIDEEKTFLTKKNTTIPQKKVKFDIIKEEVLYESPGGQQKIFCWLTESNKYTAIRIARRTNKGVFGSQEITLTPKAIKVLKKFLDEINLIDMDKKWPYQIPIKDTSEKTEYKMLSDEQFKMLMEENISSIDTFHRILTIRKMEEGIEQLEDIIKKRNNESKERKSEKEIESFLKEHLWMFGNEYTTFIKSGIINSKNILDVMPKNIRNFVDIIELKLPKEKLFNWDNSHKNYYPSAELTKVIAQTQNYIFELEQKYNDSKFQDQEDCTIIRPKATIVFGSTEKLLDEEEKYLRILNSSYHNIKIITYQQLLEKAKNTFDILNVKKEKE